ncbi:MAG: sigma-70 family RNA polymerase sigma factor [Syntrophomonadaceae bacterium]|nr:sigma-70 family RNA polymerase sigma factor [Syntrophomonadaceae bacterium]
MTQVNDLIVQAQQGDLSAFEKIVLVFQDKVYSHCLYLTGNSDDAQDLAQDVFVQSFKGIRSFRREADFGTWLHRIAVNLWINLCRRNKKATVISIDEALTTSQGELLRELAASDDSPLEQIERREFSGMVNQALNRLAPEYRTVLVLRDMEGYNYDEIASLLDCSLGTVKSRINRGRKSLKKELGKLL